MAAYSSYTLIALASTGQDVIPEGFLGITSFPVGDAWKAIGVPAGIFFWLLSFWFFAIAMVSNFVVVRHMFFTMQWWSFIFPPVALCTAGLTIGDVLVAPAVKWVFSVFTVVLVGVWIIVAFAHVRAVVKKQVLWPGMDEDDAH